MRHGFYVHEHVSEREAAHEWPDGRWDDARWEDCLWDSAVEVLRFGGLGIPAKHHEAEALRRASGEPPTGGSNHGDLERGIRARYGLSAVPQGVGMAALRSLGEGHAAVVNGSFRGFPETHRLRRHQRGFTGAHSVAVFRIDRTTRWWWCDPLAPAGYDGEWVTEAELATFVAGADGRFTYVRLGQFVTLPDTSTGGTPDMLAIVRDLERWASPRRFSVPKGTTLNGYDPSRPNQVVETFTATADTGARAHAAVSISWPGADPAPIPRGGPFLLVADGALAGLYIVAALVELDPLPAPAPAPSPAAVLERARDATIEAVGKALDGVAAHYAGGTR